MESNNESAIYHVADRFYIDITFNYQKIFFPISRKDASILINTEFLSVIREFELPKGIVLMGHAQQESKTIDALKYNMSRESFNRFTSTKKVMKPTDFDKDNEAEFYEGVEAVLVYDDEFPIYQISDDRNWEYDDFSTIDKKFGYIRYDDGTVVESDSLKDVELAAFKHYFEINDPLRYNRITSEPILSNNKVFAMPTYNNNPQFNSATLRLTDEQRQNPMLVINEFFECYQLNDFRSMIWKWLVEVLTSSGNISSDAIGREKNIFFYEKLELLIEACYLLNKRASDLSEVA